MSEAYVTQGEFKRLKARVATVEQEAEGEKLLSRYILAQARQNGDDLAALKTRVDRIEEKVDRLEADRGLLRREVTQLRNEMPAIVADAMRDVLRDSRSR